MIRPAGAADSGALTVGLVSDDLTGSGVADVGEEEADEDEVSGAPVEDGVGADEPHPANPIATSVPRTMAAVLYIRNTSLSDEVISLRNSYSRTMPSLCVNAVPAAQVTSKLSPPFHVGVQWTQRIGLAELMAPNVP